MHSDSTYTPVCFQCACAGGGLAPSLGTLLWNRLTAKVKSLCCNHGRSVDKLLCAPARPFFIIFGPVLPSIVLTVCCWDTLPLLSRVVQRLVPMHMLLPWWTGNAIKLTALVALGRTCPLSFCLEWCCFVSPAGVMSAVQTSLLAFHMHGMNVQAHTESAALAALEEMQKVVLSNGLCNCVHTFSFVSLFGWVVAKRNSKQATQSSIKVALS